jgi:hypothetical protein
MNKEKIDRFTITSIRKILRGMDLLKLNTNYFYNCYYNFILSKLNNVLNEAWIKFQKNIQNSDSIKNTDNIKRVWVMWWQGYDTAPLIIKNNIKHFSKIFGERFVLITKDNFNDYTDISGDIKEKFKLKKISFTQWSDIVRYNLLKNNGGLWIDSSVIISEKFLTIDKLFNSDYFSLCASPNTNKFISLGRWTGWCVGGKANYGLFVFMNTFFETYYSHYEKTIDYFFADDAVTFYYKKCSDFRNIIKQQEKEWDPYLFIRNFKSTNYDRLITKYESEQKFCVQKLTYKFNFDDVNRNSLAKKIELGEIK